MKREGASRGGTSNGDEKEWQIEGAGRREIGEEREEVSVIQAEREHRHGAREECGIQGSSLP